MVKLRLWTLGCTSLSDKDCRFAVLQFNHIFDITAAHVGLANFSIEVVVLQFGALFGAINMYLPTIRQADAPRSLLSVIPDQFVLR